jgi:hypothetical protein
VTDVTKNYSPSFSVLYLLPLQLSEGRNPKADLSLSSELVPPLPTTKLLDNTQVPGTCCLSRTSPFIDASRTLKVRGHSSGLLLGKRYN